MKASLVLFGAGSFGQKALAELSDDFEIVCFLDNNPAKEGTQSANVSVQSPSALPGLEYDFLVITSQFYSEILPQLKAAGVPRQKIRIYNVDFPQSQPDTVEPSETVDPAYREVMRALVGDELADVPYWDSMPAEKAVMTSILRAIRPRCAIEIGTFLGASLRVIHQFSEKVYSLDVDPGCERRLADELPCAEFIVGPSQETLPVLLDHIVADPSHPPLDFVFVDGDHTRAGVAGDLAALLRHRPQNRVVILMHDVANPECRQGMLDVDWAGNPHVHYIDLDFLPGILHHITTSYRQMWGGFGLALMLPEERAAPLAIRACLPQQYDAMYRGSFHALEKPNPFASLYQPHFVRAEDAPRFTACLPNYNDGDIIGGAIRAMLEQTRPPDELLICDDGSTGDSWDRLRELADLDGSIRLIRNAQNKGVVETLKRLLTEARGELVYFGGADDRVLPLFFENVLTLLERYPAAPLGMATFLAVAEDGQVLSVSQVSRWRTAGYYDPKQCLREYFSVEAPQHSLSSGTIYRRDRLIETGDFRTELGHWTDTFAIRVLCLQAGCVYTPHPGARFTVTPDSFSGSQYRDLSRALAIVDRAAELMRSERFRHLFPESHVIDWVNRHRDELAGFHEQESAGRG